jgi:hypothetical protein
MRARPICPGCARANRFRNRPAVDLSYLGLDSGGQSVRNSIGLPPLCTVGAAELAPPASGRIALFSIAMEFDVFSAALPVVADDAVVQLVSGFALEFALEGVVDCAAAAPATSNPASSAVRRKIMIVSRHREKQCLIHQANV